MRALAKILKSHGTDGGILIGLYDIDIQDIDKTEPVFIEIDGLPVPFFIESLQQRGNTRAIARLTDVHDLRDAEELVGLELLTEGDEEEEEEADFTGWTVYDGDRRIGTVNDMAPIPGNLCLYVQTVHGEEMIPLHEDLVCEVDPDTRTLVLELPEGLLAE